jgi:hypothetical protein
VRDLGFEIFKGEESLQWGSCVGERERGRV